MAEPEEFRIIGLIRNISVIAKGRGLRIRSYLEENYGGKNWRKMKGFAFVEETMATSVMRKSTGTKRTASVASIGKSKNASRNGAERRYPYFVLCIDNHGYLASLQIGKVYEVIRPSPKDLDSLRVVDEDGEDYLYSADRFVPIELPPRARKAVRAALTEEPL